LISLTHNSARIAVLKSICAIGVIAGLVGPAAAAEKVDTKKPSFIGKTVANFVLPDGSGKQTSLADFSDKKCVVVFFLGTSCPISNLYLTELNQLQKEFADQGLQVIGVNSNSGVTLEEIAKHSREFKAAFPVLLDEGQRVAKQMGAIRTAEAYLLDQQSIVRYHGRVDDRFGYTYKNKTPKRRDLREAVTEVLAGQPVSLAETKPLGCLITHDKGAVQETEITFAKDISRILQKRCHECHRPGMVGPFSLLTYDDAKDWTAMMKEVVLEGRMPPWHADPRYGHWSNNRKMPQEEIDKLIAWIEADAPFGDEKDLPPEPQYEEGWAIGKPDMVFELPEEVEISADGVVPYLYFRVPTNFEEDVYIQAAEARPGNRAVVHHIIAFIGDPKDRDSRNRDFLCGTAPGDPPMILEDGVAKKVPAGSELIFQMHYTPTGREEKDRSQLGIIFHKGDQPPRDLAKTRAVLNTEFEIPAGEANHVVRSSYTFRNDVKLLSLMPHMHLRGKDFQYRAVYPDGKSEILLSIPRYDFNWQNTYRFATPLTLPRGSRIDCLAHFDNSADNPANPDATKPVRWGDQTWEEMMIGWVNYIDDNTRRSKRRR